MRKQSSKKTDRHVKFISVLNYLLTIKIIESEIK